MSAVDVFTPTTKCLEWTVHNWYSVLGDVGETGKQAGGKVAPFVWIFTCRSQQTTFAHPHRMKVSVVRALQVQVSLGEGGVVNLALNKGAIRLCWPLCHHLRLDAAREAFRHRHHRVKFAPHCVVNPVDCQ